MDNTNDKLSALPGRKQIIIIENNIGNMVFLRSALEARYDVTAVEKCEDALRMIGEGNESPGLVLLCMSEGDPGVADILKRAKEDPLLKHIPVVAMSGRREDEAYALNNGALDFIITPCPSIEAVLAHVCHAFELSENLNIIRSTERDQLTGLYNKEYFFNYAVQFDMYHSSLDMDAIIVNISHFHMINERYGKVYGDDLLRHIGTKLREHVAPEGGIVCRRDADTFLIYCPHRTDYEELLAKACGGFNNQVRLRMGIYPNVDKKLDIERRFDRAKLASDTVRESYDKALAFYDNRLHESEIYIEQLLEEFPTALAERQFVVYYQPKFAIQSTLPVLNSAEALVRWIHPRRGMISPGDFIPLFESNGLIRQLDSYVWREVAAQMREWKDRIGVCVPISVNVSRIDILDGDLVEHMKGLVEEFGLSREEFLLEITESAYTQDSEHIIETVKALRNEGFQIEIDDFGSGYSSLNMISTVPFDALKLDMEFMRNAFRERKNTKMLDAVIDIAYSLEVPTIAEGVETAEQMFALKAMGCDIVQGFYFSRPLPAAEFEVFLMEKKDGRGHIIDNDKESKIKAAEQFTYEAMHDALTGLYNHSAYKMLLKDADQRNIALLLADVEDFEGIEREHGADVANRILECVADVLRHNFRSVDFICRIGDDEFAIIMTRVNREMSELVHNKGKRINDMLKELPDGLPPVGLNIGVAFADRENPQGDIFQDADSALQRIKQLKQYGCAIF